MTSTKEITVPAAPARPVRPARWIYISWSSGGSYKNTCESAGMSIPLAATSVATKKRKLPAAILANTLSRLL